jgi:hypothetical protein
LLKMLAKSSHAAVTLGPQLFRQNAAARRLPLTRR